MKQKTFKKAFVASLPVMAGYIILGFGFGILLQSKGYNFIWAGFMSLTIYAGSMQYVAVDILSSGATLISAALITLMVNARHLFYGISMLDKYKDTGNKKPFLIFMLTDETYSLLCMDNIPEGIDKNLYYLFVSVLNQMYWITGSVLGALLGLALQFNSKGIEFAMTALFTVIFTEQWLSTKNHLPAIIGLSVTLACLLIFGASNFIIPSMAGITLMLTLFKSVLSKEDSADA